MYACLDHTAQVFLNPLNFQNDGDAIRWFTTVVNSEKEDNNISKYPEQFTLYRLADYDDQLGTFQPRLSENETLAMQPKELIKGIAVQDVEKQKFSLKDMINMLKQELEMNNVKNIKEAIK